MVKKEDLYEGCSVHYRPEHYGSDHWENGVVKTIREDVDDKVWVVYNCNGEWHRFRDYTGAVTRLTDLYMNWRF